MLTNEAYFGGGTVSGLSVGAPFWDARRAGGSSAGFSTVHERLEHGTPPYLDIIALGHAMDTYRRLYRSLKYISLHASSLSNFTSHQLSLIRHANGLPVVQQHRLVGCLHLEPPGPIIGFSLLDARGAYIGHAQLERLATLHAFSIRSGGMCNTGVWTSVMGLSDLDLQRLRHQGRACWDDEEFDGNKPLGLARISFGACSTLEDAVAFIDFIRRFFVDPGVSPEAFQREETFDTRKRDVKLRQLTLCEQRIFLAVSSLGPLTRLKNQTRSNHVRDRAWQHGISRRLASNTIGNGCSSIHALRMRCHKNDGLGWS